MIIRKITEYDEKCKVERILLICDDKDEGWEMTKDELMTLRDLIDKAYPPAASPPHTPISNQMLVDKNREIAKLNEDIEVLCKLDATHCDEIDQLKADLNRNVLERDRLMEHLSLLSTEKKTLEAELKEKEKYIDEASKTYTLITDEKHVLYEEVKRLEKKLEEMTMGKLISPGETLDIDSLDSTTKKLIECFKLPEEILSKYADRFEKELEVFKLFNEKVIAVKEEECPDYIDPSKEITSIDYGTPNGDLTSIVTIEKTSDDLKIIEVKVESLEERKCRLCGCTQNNACEGGCYWVEIDLCSKCRDKINAREVVEAEKEIFREQNYDFPRIKRERRDYTKYIKMYRDGAEQKEIEESLAEDFGIAKSTATQNYYSKVKAEALKQIENEKVVIVDENKPAPGKFFTDAERKRIQEAARIK